MVSIIIPLYNYANYIQECLESCPEPDGVNVEIVVVDDCSTDGPEEYLEHYEQMHPRGFQMLRNPKNMGYSYSKNVGIINSSGDYIVHLDADDMLLPNSVVTRFMVLRDNSNIDMVHGMAERYRDGVPDGVNPKSSIHAQGVMIKKVVYEKYGLYYEGLRSMSDKEMWYRLGIHQDSPLKRKIVATKIPVVVAYYRKHDKQMHKVRRRKPGLNKAIKKIFKHRIKQLADYGITSENTRFM